MTLNQYEARGRVFRAREGFIHLPNELKDVITGAFGFDQRPQAVPHFRLKGAGKRGIGPRAVSGRHLTRPTWRASTSSQPG